MTYHEGLNVVPCEEKNVDSFDSHLQNLLF